MRRNRHAPPWYVEGDVGASIRNARDVDADPDEIVSTLSRYELEELSDGRIEAIVEATPESESADVDLPLSQSPSTDATPRSQPARGLSIDDLEYLSRRELARVVGLALEQFEGTTVRPAANQDVAVDCYWHRQQMTVGLRTVPTTDGLVGADHVAAIAEGTVRLEDIRMPSELAVVTNEAFDDDATALAEEHGVRLFDGGHMATWLRRTAIPSRVVGTVLEEGENHDGPLDELVDLSPIPEPRQSEDPFEIDPAFDITVFEYDEYDIGEATPDEPDPTSEQSGQTTDNDGLLTREQAPAGETGTLYADPEEDGDYDAFDDYLERL